MSDECVFILNSLHSLMMAPEVEREFYKDNLLKRWKILRDDLLSENSGPIREAYHRSRMGTVVGCFLSLLFFAQAIQMFINFLLNLKDNPASQLFHCAVAVILALIPLCVAYSCYRFTSGRLINEMDAFMTILSKGEEIPNTFRFFKKPSMDENITPPTPEHMV